MLDLARDGLLYLDTSALMKLVVDEAETAALREELARWGEGRLVTSALTKVELPRAVTRAVAPVVLGDRLQAVTQVLEAINIIPLNDNIIVVAAQLQPPMLRSLDAIHLASARAVHLGARSTVVCGYDRRLRIRPAAAGSGRRARPAHDQPHLASPLASCTNRMRGSRSWTSISSCRC